MPQFWASRSGCAVLHPTLAMLQLENEALACTVCGGPTEPQNPSAVRSFLKTLKPPPQLFHGLVPNLPAARCTRRGMLELLWEGCTAVVTSVFPGTDNRKWIFNYYPAVDVQRYHSHFFSAGHKNSRHLNEVPQLQLSCTSFFHGPAAAALG